MADPTERGRMTDDQIEEVAWKLGYELFGQDPTAEDVVRIRTAFDEIVRRTCRKASTADHTDRDRELAKRIEHERYEVCAGYNLMYSSIRWTSQMYDRCNSEILDRITSLLAIYRQEAEAAGVRGAIEAVEKVQQGWAYADDFWSEDVLEALRALLPADLTPASDGSNADRTIGAERQPTGLPEAESNRGGSTPSGDAAAETERQAEDLLPVRRALGFFACVIKSGEGWSQTAQEMYEAAWAALDCRQPLAEGETVMNTATLALEIYAAFPGATGKVARRALKEIAAWNRRERRR